MKKISLIIIVLIALFAAVWLYVRAPSAPSTTAIPVSYACNNGKTIDATLYEGTSTPKVEPGQPPVPTGRATVILSDGRKMDLAQTLSADGVRYANADESFVFWSKGNGALVLENNKEKSYIGCVVVKPDTNTSQKLPNVYQNGTEGISVRYPEGYAVTKSYVYQEFGPGKGIYGVKFTIPEAVATGTNLGQDSYISIESIPRISNCSAALFLPDQTTVQEKTDNGAKYSVASSTGAAAGNRYEEYVYALPGTNPCIAVRYFIHYGVYENYPPNTVRRFDEKALISRFDAIRRSLTVNQ